MEFHVSLEGRGDLAARIYRELLDAIFDGRLRSGERLPPTRELAPRLGVSRNTVAVAYDRLIAEGFLVGRVGAGTFVCSQPVTRAQPRNAPAGSDLRPRALWADIPATPAVPPTGTPEFDFRVGCPDPQLFPLATWRGLVSGELRRSTLPPGYTDPAGHPGLRAAIARSVGVSRSVCADADDVIVTQGAQQALDVVGRVLIEPGSRVAVEEPGYPPARMLFRSLGAQVVGVPVDGEGLDVAALPHDARLVFVTPSHQFPLGTPMSLARRAALLAWAERHDAVIVEDDYDSEFRYEGRPLEPLQSIDSCGRVIYVGSFSKTLLPALRLGFLVAPASLRPALRAAKQLTDWHGDPAAQGALARFVDEGMFVRHVRKATREYAARHAAVMAALRERFAAWLSPVPSAAGLHLCARAVPGTAAVVERALVRARAAGIGVESLADYCGERPTQHGLVIGYGVIERVHIDAGMQKLAECFDVP